MVSRRSSPENPQPNFDRVARVYRWAEFLLLGPLLQRTRLQFLPDLRRTRQALVLGDGDGRFLAELLRHSPDLHGLAVDLSPAMLHLLRRRCRFAQSRLSTVQGSVTELATARLPRGIDLVATHFFLDCLTQDQVAALSRMLAAHTAPGCLWVISEFGLPASSPWRALASAYIRFLYFAFRVLTGLRVRRLPDIPAALEAAGWRRLSRIPRLKGLLYSELWAAPLKINPLPHRATSLHTRSST